MKCITARRMTSGELLKYRKGFGIWRCYVTLVSASIQIALTLLLAAIATNISLGAEARGRRSCGGLDLGRGGRHHVKWHMACMQQ